MVFLEGYLDQISQKWFAELVYGLQIHELDNLRRHTFHWHQALISAVQKGIRTMLDSSIISCQIISNLQAKYVNMPFIGKHIYNVRCCQQLQKRQGQPPIQALIQYCKYKPDWVIDYDVNE